MAIFNPIEEWLTAVGEGYVQDVIVYGAAFTLIFVGLIGLFVSSGAASSALGAATGGQARGAIVVRRAGKLIKGKRKK